MLTCLIRAVPLAIALTFVLTTALEPLKRRLHAHKPSRREHAIA